MQRHRVSALIRFGIAAITLITLLGAAIVPATPAGAATSARVFFLRDGAVGSARRTAIPQDISIFDGTVNELLHGPRPDEQGAGLQTALNDTIKMVKPIAVDEQSGIATVDFSAEFNDARPNVIAQRMAQVVYTLTQFQAIRGVAFQVESKPIAALDGSGTELRRAAVRGDYEGLTPAIFLETPEVLTAVRSPIRARGTANTFEATFMYALYDGDNKQLASGFETATSGTGTRGRFNFTIDYTLEENQRGTLVLYEQSAKDGTPINVVAVPLELRRSVSGAGTATATQTSPATATVTATSTTTPTATATLRPTIAPASQTPTAVATATSTVRATNTPAPRPTNTPVPTTTPKPKPTNTATPKPTNTATPKPTNTATPKPTKTPTPKPTNTATPRPTNTATPKPTNTATPKPTSTPTQVPVERGSITISVFNCPLGMDIEHLVTADCNPVSTGFAMRLTSSELGVDVTLNDATNDRGSFRWSSLPFGTYLLRQTTLPSGYTTYYIPRNAIVEGSASTGYSISLDEISHGQVRLSVYNLAPKSPR